MRVAEVPGDYTLLSGEILAYAAGLFDGEGCLSIQLDNSRDYTKRLLRVDLSNTDRAVIEWLTATFGGNIHEWEPEPPRRRNFIWNMTGRPAFNFIRAIHPYSIVKRTQIEMGMYFCQLGGERQNEQALLTELLRKEKRRESPSMDLKKKQPTAIDL